MAVDLVRCPHCQSGEGVKYGTPATGTGRLRGQQNTCGRTVIRAYAYQGRLPQVKRQIGERTLTGRGGRDSARVRQIRPTTVLEE